MCAFLGMTVLWYCVILGISFYRFFPGPFPLIIMIVIVIVIIIIIIIIVVVA